MPLKNPSDLFDEGDIKKIRSSYNSYNSYKNMSEIKSNMIREEFNGKLNDITETIDSNIQILNDKFEESSTRLRKDVAVYNNLTKIIEGKVERLDRDDEKISLIEKNAINLDKKLLDVELKNDIISEEIDAVRGEVESIDIKFKETAKNIKYVEESTDKLNRKISNTKIELELEIDDKIDNLSKTIDSVSESLEKVELEFKDDSLRKDIDSISERVDSKVEQIDTKIGEITQLVEDKSKSDSEEINIVKEDNAKFKRSVSDNLVEYKIKTDDNLKEISNSIDIFNEDIKKEIDLFNEDLKKESDRIDNRVNEIVEDNNKSFKKYDKKLRDESLKFDDKIKNVVEENNNSIEEYASKLRNEITDVKVDVVINEKTIKKIDNFLNENHKELNILKDEVFTEIGNLPIDYIQNNISKLESKIDYIRETYSKINTEEIVREVVKENLISEPLDGKNDDPISDDSFVTLQQLQEHYRLFINRIQQQLSTLGGGGAVKIKDMDDVDSSALVNEKFLQYNSTTKKWQGADAGVDLSQTQIFTGGIAEKFQTGTTLAADNTLALSDGNVIRRTDNESGNQTVNFTGVHSTLSSGQVVSFTVIITPNGSGVITAVQIDGQAITIKWSGGSAPSAGSSGKDVYTFSVFKTGTGVSDYEVYGAATNYA